MIQRGSILPTCVIIPWLPPQAGCHLSEAGKLQNNYAHSSLPRPSINQVFFCLFPAHLQNFKLCPNMHLLAVFPVHANVAWFACTMERADHTFPALACLEGSMRHSSVIFLRWHHVMTQKPALTCKAVLKLHSVPEDKICCGGESAEDFKHSKGWLSDVFSHQSVWVLS